jgi:hypothetical protein
MIHPSPHLRFLPANLPNSDNPVGLLWLMMKFSISDQVCQILRSLSVFRKNCSNCSHEEQSTAKTRIMSETGLIMRHYSRYCWTFRLCPGQLREMITCYAIGQFRAFERLWNKISSRNTRPATHWFFEYQKALFHLRRRTSLPTMVSIHSLILCHLTVCINATTASLFSLSCTLTY